MSLMSGDRCNLCCAPFEYLKFKIHPPLLLSPKIMDCSLKSGIEHFDESSIKITLPVKTGERKT